METGSLFKSVLLFLCAFSFVGCMKDDEQEERKVIGYEEYTLIVASKKIPGVVTSCGCSNLSEVYAVKIENSQEWESYYGIEGFDYENGYEYRIQVSQTTYLDYRRSEPAWSECKLLKILSKEKKDSEGLPENFIPDWFYEQEK